MYKYGGDPKIVLRLSCGILRFTWPSRALTGRSLYKGTLIPGDHPFLIRLLLNY